MRIVSLTWGLVAACLLAVAVPYTAQAQATRTWVSGVGDDVNPCSRTAPCKTFPGAISKTAAGGEIDALDPGGYGAVTITKAITIAAEGGGEAGILVAGTNGITINAGANDVVILRGLQIDGGPIGSNSLSGVKFIAGKTLEIENSTIRNFTGGSPNGYGVFFTPAAGNTQLLISDTTITTNGQIGGSGGGVFVTPTGSASVTGSLTNVNVFNNVTGVRADASQTTGSILLSLNHTVVSGNQFAGVVAYTQGGSGIAKVVLADSSSTGNATGINANGAGATIRLTNSVLAGNATGANTANGGTLTSNGNNQINDNTNPGAAIPVVGPN